MSAAVVEVERSRSGAPTLKWRGKHLISAYDPEKEAERYVAGVVAEGTSVVVLLGLGLGHHAVAAAKRGARVVAVERRPEIAEAARRAGVWAAVEASGLGTAVVGLDGPALREAIRDRLDIWTLRRVVTLPGPAPAEDAAYYRAAKDLVGVAVEEAVEHVKTVEDFARIWLTNALANLEAAAVSPTLAALRGRWSGRPAVLLAAGPSAGEGIEMLARASARPPVVAVDAALPMALARGLVPDAVIAADPQERAARHILAAGEIPEIPFLHLLVAHPAAVGRFRRRVLLGAHYPLEDLLGLGPADRLDSTGGSVATVAAAVLAAMGAAPIVLVGQDLSLPGGRMYATGGLADAEAVEAAGRFATIETARRRFTAGQNLRDVPAAAGGTVRATPNLVSYRRWFEAQAARGLRLVQTSPVGARIEGADHIPLDVALRGQSLASETTFQQIFRMPPAVEKSSRLRGADPSAWAAEAERIGDAIGAGEPPEKFASSPVYRLVEHLVVAEAFGPSRAEPARAREILSAAARRAGAEIAERLAAIPSPDPRRGAPPRRS